MGRLEEKIAGVLLYWLHSFPLACLIFSHNVWHTSCFLLGKGEGVWIFVVLHVLMKVLTIYPWSPQHVPQVPNVFPTCYLLTLYPTSFALSSTLGTQKERLQHMDFLGLSESLIIIIIFGWTNQRFPSQKQKKKNLWWSPQLINNINNKIPTYIYQSYIVLFVFHSPMYFSASPSWSTISFTQI